ncbi:MAG TPA: hypothetical protein DCY79_19855, partial [Planctomycetaceae bacterium]|nr:hypothetical protein [Planctomycetaceae bacterium]
AAPLAAAPLAAAQGLVPKQASRHAYTTDSRQRTSGADSVDSDRGPSPEFRRQPLYLRYFQKQTEWTNETIGKASQYTLS